MRSGPAIAWCERPQRVLDDPILERVKRNRDQARARLQAPRHGLQKFVDVVELAVHPDAKRLKRARRRIDPREPVPRHRSSHNRGELSGRLERRRFARLHDAARDAPRESLLAEPVDRVRDLCLFRAAQQLRGGRARCRVHPHVERVFALEAEPAPFGFELIRRHAHVGQRAVDAIDPAGLQYRRDRPIIRVHELHAIAVPAQRLGGDAQRGRIAIEPDHLRRSGFEQRERVPAHAHGAIDEHAALFGLQKREHLARHHRLV